MRETIQTCLHNGLKFRFCLMDCWFNSKENFEFIASKGRRFIDALKDNRLEKRWPTTMIKLPSLRTTSLSHGPIAPLVRLWLGARYSLSRTSQGKEW